MIGYSLSPSQIFKIVTLNTWIATNSTRCQLAHQKQADAQAEVSFVLFGAFLQNHQLGSVGAIRACLRYSAGLYRAIRDFVIKGVAAPRGAPHEALLKEINQAIQGDPTERFGTVGPIQRDSDAYPEVKRQPRAVIGTY